MFTPRPPFALPVTVALALVVAVGAPAAGDQLPLAVREQLKLLVANGKSTAAVPATETPAELVQNVTASDAVANYLFELDAAAQPSPVDLNQLRNDLQLGAMSARTGSTSIVARSGISELLSAAIESGAITRKTDETSVTFSANALMVRQLLSGELPTGCGSLDDACRQGPGRWLRGLSGSATFSMAGSTVVPEESTGGVALLNGRALTAISIRYEMFVRERRNATIKQKLEKIVADTEVQKKSAAYLEATNAFQERISKVAADSTWVTKTQEALAAETSRADAADPLLNRLEKVLLARYRLLHEQLKASPEFDALQTAAFATQRLYIARQNALLAEQLYRKALTVDYVHERPSTQPELHQIRAVFSTPLGHKPDTGTTTTLEAPAGAFTVNAGLSMFRPELTPPEGWKLRDAQVSAALDWTPVRTGDLRPTYTVAYYFQYMVANGVIEFDKTAITPGGSAIPLPKTAVELLDTKGAIHVAQFRVSIPAAKGVSFPLALSYSNRSELIVGKSFWQGHVGVAYDLGVLKQALAKRSR
jgi:hypothetical protein